MESEIDFDRTNWDRVLGREVYPNVVVSRETDEVTLKNIKFISRRNQQILDLRNSTTTKVIFENCHFSTHGSDSFSDLEVRRGQSRHLIMENCSISTLSINSAERLHLKNLKIAGLIIHDTKRARVDSTLVDTFSANNTNFVSEVKLLPNEKETSINISKCIFEKSLIISEQNLKTLNLKDSTINKDKLQIQKCHFSTSPKLDSIKSASISIKSNTGEYLIISDFKTNSLNIYRNKADIDISYGSMTQGKINLNQGDIYIENIQNRLGLLLDKNVSRNIIINNQWLDKITFSKNSSNLSFNTIFCNQFPDLSENSFSEISIKEVKQDQSNWELTINKAQKVKLNNLNLESLGIIGSDVQEILLSELNSNLNLVLKNGNQLDILNNKTGGCNLKINLEQYEKFSIEECRYTNAILEGRENGVVQLSKNNLDNVLIVFESTKRVEISKLKSNKVDIKDSQIDELIIAEKKEDVSEILNLSIQHSGIKHLLANTLTINTFTLQKLISEKFEFLPSQYETLKILECNTNQIYFGENNEIEAYDTHWLFNKTPSLNLKVEKSKISELYIEHGAEHERNVNPLSIHLSSSTINNLESKGLIIQLLSTEFCEIETALHSTVSTITPAEIASNQDKYGTLEFINSAGKASFNNSTFKLIRFNHCTFEVLEISDCQSDDHPYAIEELKIQDSQINRLNAHDSKIKKLDINNLRPSEFRLSDLSIHDFLLNKFKKNQNPTEFELNFINIEDQSRRGSISFIDSDLSELSFNSCYFESFKELVVKSSKLDKINCTATTWPQMVTSPEGKKKQFEIREACRQLKFAMAAHHDKVSELLFHALEMNAYRKIVRSKGWHPRFWNDRLSLLAGSSNNFGLNWFIPLVLITLFLTLNYIAILYSHCPIDMRTSNFWCLFEWTDFFLLFNPTHRLDQLSLTGDIGGWTAFWDFFSRIISAFFIYQIVAAFRKFRK